MKESKKIIWSFLKSLDKEHPWTTDNEDIENCLNVILDIYNELKKYKKEWKAWILLKRDLKYEILNGFNIVIEKEILSRPKVHHIRSTSDSGCATSRNSGQAILKKFLNWIEEWSYIEESVIDEIHEWIDKSWTFAQINDWTKERVDWIMKDQER